MGDDKYVKGMQILIRDGVMQISTLEKTGKIRPDSIVDKKQSGWWADGSISDGAFVSAMQYLIASEILDTDQKTSNPSSSDSSTSVSSISSDDFSAG